MNSPVIWPCIRVLVNGVSCVTYVNDINGDMFKKSRRKKREKEEYTSIDKYEECLLHNALAKLRDKGRIAAIKSH